MTGAEYKAIRKRLRLTQAEMADALGVSRKTIGLRELGKAVIGTEAELAIAHLAACSERGRGRGRGETQ